MSAKIVDKRTTDPDDSDRMAKRRAVREAAARRDLELAPAVQAEADIKLSEQRIEAATDKHGKKTRVAKLTG